MRNLIDRAVIGSGHETSGWLRAERSGASCRHYGHDRYLYPLHLGQTGASLWPV